MARIIIKLGECSMADVDQLIKEVTRKKYVIDAWKVTEEEYAAQQGFAADETNRLRDLLWVGCLCGACGHSYRYNRADDPTGEKGHEEHLLAYPDCPSSRR